MLRERRKRQFPAVVDADKAVVSFRNRESMPSGIFLFPRDDAEHILNRSVGLHLKAQIGAEAFCRHTDRFIFTLKPVVK